MTDEQWGLMAHVDHAIRRGRDHSRMRSNPYDRRQKPAFASGGALPMPDMRFGFAGPPRMALALEDIDALADSAFRRGRQEADAEMTRVRIECQLSDKREAWDEGWRAGHGDGGVELLQRIDRVFGGRARRLLERNGEMLRDDEVGKGTLRDQLQITTRLLAELVQAHHDGFPEPRDPENG